MFTAVPGVSHGQIPNQGQVVISQIYGNGGVGSIYNSGYLEVFNRGTSTAYLSGSIFTSGPPSLFEGAVSFFDSGGYPIEPGQYRLIRMSGSGTFGADIPQVDFEPGGISFRGFNGQFAIVASGSPTESGPCQLPNSTFVDFVGFGTTTCFEGSAPAPATTLTTALHRRGNGCVDTNDASNDFVIGPPAPRNGSSPFNPCSSVGATVSGKVLTPDGRALRGITVTIVDFRGTRRAAVTSSFGVFIFDGVAIGENHTISVSSKRYRFASQIAQVNGNLTLQDFVGLE